MTTLISAGKYLSRNVYVATATFENLQLTEGALQSMVVFVSMDEPDLSNAIIAQCIPALLAARPLTLIFFGKGSDDLSEGLVRYLNQNPQERFTFVLHSHETTLEEALDSFFTSAWPPQERWDDWKEYLVLGIGTLPLEMLHEQVAQHLG